jgi:hypothetical protein
MFCEKMNVPLLVVVNSLLQNSSTVQVQAAGM